MRKSLLMLLIMLAAVAQGWAQGRTISGKVVDVKTGQAISGVTISSGGKNTITDASGNFKISTTANTVSVMSVGYERAELKLGSSNTLNVSLNPSSQELDAVVVTGYSREKKSQFAGAATQISGKAVETVPVGAFDQALQGRVPGMLVNSGSGQPGSSAQITIRGIKSIVGAGAQPLFVIDGVPLPAFDMQTINPDDFESITVLKDANAAALYGARGGTGVVVITTKTGKAGQTNFQYRTQFGFTQRPNFTRMNLMNTKEMLAYEEREKLGGTPGWVYSPKNPAIPAGMTADRKQFILDSISQIDINYANIFFRQGLSQNHELVMNGGNDKTKYYVSGGYFNQEGIDLGSQLRRFTLRFNLDHNVNNKLFVSLRSTFGYSKTKYSEGELLGNSPRNPFQMTYRAKTYENPYKPDGSLNFGANTSLALKQVANLLEGIQNSSRNTDQIKVNAAATILYKFTQDFSFKNVFGLDASSNYAQRYVNPNSYIGSLQTFQSGIASESYGIYSQFVNTSSLNYLKRFDRHELEAGAYFEMVRAYDRGMGFTIYNLDPRLTETGQGAGPLPTNGAATYPQYASSAKSGYGIRSYFATLKYSYDNRYSINGNIRRDGTSRIVNEENREITTWSAGLIWNVLNEKFMRNQKIFSEFKARVSYGIVPNIGSIPTGGYGYGVPNYQGPQIPTFGTTTYAGSSITGLVPTAPGNPNLRIEKIQKLNWGFDLGFWQNRATLSMDIYDEKTVDLFVSQPLSGTTGFSSLNINAGVMRNKGMEFLAKAEIIRKKNFGFTLGLNHSINKNNIEDLGLVNEYFLGTFVIRKGLPYGSHYTYNYIGADPATGQPIFETPDGKTTFDVSKAGQFAKFGTYLPKHQGGVDLTVRFRSITVSALFSYQFDVVRSNNTRNWITRGTPGYHGAVRASRELIDMQWTKPGDNKLYQSSAYDRGFTSSDLEDAKFLRFRNLNISYAIPEIRTNSGKLLIKSSRFYIQGQNLAIWSPWRGLDPEDNNNISLNEYPNPTMFVAGLDINF